MAPATGAVEDWDSDPATVWETGASAVGAAASGAGAAASVVDSGAALASAFARRASDFRFRLRFLGAGAGAASAAASSGGLEGRSASMVPSRVLGLRRDTFASKDDFTGPAPEPPW